MQLEPRHSHYTKYIQLKGLRGRQLASFMMTSSNGNIFRVTGHVLGSPRSPVTSPHKGQWRGALMFSLICVWINGWVNNREAGDFGTLSCPLWRHCNVFVIGGFVVSRRWCFMNCVRTTLTHPNVFIVLVLRMQGSFCVCDQPMRDGTGCIYKMIPVRYVIMSFQKFVRDSAHFFWAAVFHCLLNTSNNCSTSITNQPTNQPTNKSTDTPGWTLSNATIIPSCTNLISIAAKVIYHLIGSLYCLKTSAPYDWCE